MAPEKGLVRDFFEVTVFGQSDFFQVFRPGKSKLFDLFHAVGHGITRLFKLRGIIYKLRSRFIEQYAVYAFIMFVFFGNFLLVKCVYMYKAEIIFYKEEIV